MKPIHITNKNNSLQNIIERAQKHLAAFLSSSFNRLSYRAQKTSLMLFGLVAGSICMLLIVQSFSGSHGQTRIPVNSISVAGKIHVPQIAHHHLEQSSMFRHKRSPDSKSTLYDSMLLHHPGLSDSIDRQRRLLEHQQITKLLNE